MPAAGRFLFRDLRDEGVDGDDDATNFRGAAAFQWQDELTYAPADERLRMLGRATAAIEPSDGPAFTLVADRFDVDVREPENQTAPPSLGGMTATGDVELKSADGSGFLCEQVRYDEAEGTMTATGASGVRLFDDRGVPAGRFATVIYDLKTGQIRQLRGLTGE